MKGKTKEEVRTPVVPVPAVPATEATVYAPEFLDNLTEYANDLLSNWLKQNAPERIFELRYSLDWLFFVMRIAPQDDQSRQSTVDHVMRLINLVTELGGEWNNGLTSTAPRKPVV